MPLLPAAQEYASPPVTVNVGEPTAPTAPIALTSALTAGGSAPGSAFGAQAVMAIAEHESAVAIKYLFLMTIDLLVQVNIERGVARNQHPPPRDRPRHNKSLDRMRGQAITSS
ncbi:MAG TPA: hypothetical protein VF516_04735 [Kofleriaceae bacterium]